MRPIEGKELEVVREFLEAHPAKPCPNCGVNNWDSHLHRNVVKLELSWPQPVRWETMRALVLVCRHCYFLSQFAYEPIEKEFLDKPGAGE